MNTLTSAWRHFKTVCKHKYVVYQECKACGIAWQGITHDLSKFSREEFLPSAKYFQGDKRRTEAEKENCGYTFAWLHHKGCNPHHWEFWTDFNDKDGSITVQKIPYKYVVEMVCDWIGAGRIYQGGWTPESPMIYYKKKRAGRHYHPDTDNLIIKFLESIRDKGLDEFHRMARCEPPYSNLQFDYDGKQS